MKRIVALMMGLVFILSACNNEIDELETFYVKFQETLDVESEISDISDEFNRLENRRGEIQEDLSSAERDELSDMSESLAENTAERRELIDEEARVMEESKEVANEAGELTGDISNEEYRQQAEALIAAANDRYEKHDELMESFRNVLGSEEELFEYLQQDENLSQDDIDDHINTLNEEYDGLTTLQEEYTTATERLNEVKNEVYAILDES
ncbi:YkyA family protein [Lacicoccus qingdaonensis]|uniref:Putative cell-wall binding lipoprotein n=1 Tax=Lacicoccus qingdaonensis TaxID=576118 RepID=A0A1G8ZZH8_9BACL|nr:YkyA family protein [Salinicoccus qingdaonensis]SDK19550.1 Putative cell-wall binding lipoprotein [Salinicoccus qingdaonensis]